MEVINSNKAANKNKHFAPSATSGRTVSSNKCAKLGMFLLFAAKYDKICAMTISFVRLSCQTMFRVRAPTKLLKTVQITD